MAKSIIAHPAQESTEKEKAASCSDCGGHRFPRRELREGGPEEVGPEEASWSLTVCEAPQALCRSCARRHRVL